MIKKKAFLIIVLVLLMSLCQSVSHAKKEVFKLDDAIYLAIKNSASIKEIRMSLIEKDIAKSQGYEAIADIRKKESTVRFSLLFSIEWPEKHGLPKEIGLIMKIPEIEKDIAILKKQLVDQKRKVELETRSLYFDILLEERFKSSYLSRILDKRKTQERIFERLKVGIADEKDYKRLNEKLEILNKNYSNKAAKLANLLDKLSLTCNTNLTYGYSFDEKALVEVSIERSEIDKIIEYAEDKNMEVIIANEESKLAIRDVREIKGIYDRRFGNKVSVLDSMLQQNKIDVDEFYERYKIALRNIKSVWDGAYEIKIIFFTIRIPKHWFQGEYDGLRYFEDEKYALFLSVLNREKKLEIEKEKRQEFKESIKDSFSTLKELERSYNILRKSVKGLEQNYKKSLEQNKIGLVKFSELESQKENYELQNDALYEAFVEYNKQIASFDYSSASYLKALFKENLHSEKTLESGESRKDKNLDNFTYYVSDDVDDYKFNFKIVPNSSIDVDSFELYTDENIMIGERTAIKSSLSAVPVVFHKVTKFYVKFFKSGRQLAIGSFDGSNESGLINIEKTLSTLPKKELEEYGNYEISNDKYKSIISFNLDKRIDFDKADIYLLDKKIHSLQKGSMKFSEISKIDKNLGDISIIIYKEGKKINELKLKDNKIILK